MNLSVPGVVMLVAGAILCYAAVNNVDPRDVIRYSLMGQSGQGRALSKAFATGAQAGADALKKPAGTTGYGTGTQGVWV